MVGLGPIGTGILTHLLERHHEVLAVVDSDPSKAGKTVRDVTRIESDLRIHPGIRDVDLEGVEVAVFATVSQLKALAPNIEYVLAHRVCVVSTCEELAFPKFDSDSEARLVDAMAKENEVSILGTGVNPGFVMDWVPAVVASASKNPTFIHVVRSVDLSRRRKRLQSKMGVGLSRANFEKHKAARGIGHVGLRESLGLIGSSLGGEIEDFKEGVFPVVGSEDYVLGARQFAEGRVQGCQIRLDMEMTMTSADFDVVEVKGDPHLKLRFEGGVFGDSATAALVVHGVERIRRARPGLITVMDLPLTAR